MDVSVPEYGRTALRDPKVIEEAQRVGVRIRLGGSAPALLLVSTAVVDEAGQRDEELRRLAQLFVRMTVALEQDDPSPVLLDELGFLANWTSDRRTWFRTAFGEALYESLRANDPAPARELLAMSAAAESTQFGPGVTGALTPEADAHLAELLPLRAPAGE